MSRVHSKPFSLAVFMGHIVAGISAQAPLCEEPRSTFHVTGQGFSLSHSQVLRCPLQGHPGGQCTKQGQNQSWVQVIRILPASRNAEFTEQMLPYVTGANPE